MEINNAIRNLNELLQPHLHQNVTVLEFIIKRLTSAGENYGSLMLAVDVKLQNKEYKGETLHLVAKLSPPSEWLKKAFNTAITFKKEIAIYKTIIPTLRAFQKEQGVSNVINCFPECFGARVTLNLESDVVDDDAVLLLENLKISGFEVVDRMKGFDLETTKLLLKDMAVFHAVPIAVKLMKPDVFKEKILSHLIPSNVFGSSMPDDVKQTVIDFLVKSAKANPECVPFIKDIEQSLKLNLQHFSNPPPPREPFATIIHDDYWINNTMIKFENGLPVRNKMVDFQLIDYGSPGKDIVFMLLSSVQKDVLDKHYDNLVKLYYNTFISTLKELKCDTTPFTFELLLEEIDYSARTTEFFHVMAMLKHILAIKDKVKDIAEMTEEDILSESQVSNEFRQRAPEVILEFIKRKWIQLKN